MKEQLEEMKKMVASVEADLEKFEAGNSSAGTRVRGAMQNIKTIAQSIRVGVQEIKNSKKK